MASQLTVTTGQTTGVAATAVNDQALIAFSTAGACYVERLATQATGSGSQQTFACPAPRLANDGTTASRLVFEAGDGIAVGGHDPARAVLGAEIFVGARVVYWGIYLAGIPGVRTAVWSVGLVGLVIMGSAAL